MKSDNARLHAYLQYLKTLTPEEKCACGYAPVGKCHRCSDLSEGKGRLSHKNHDPRQLKLFEDATLTSLREGS